MDVKPGYKQTEVGLIPEEWEVKRLGELATFHKGKGLPKSALDPFGSEPCIHYGELFTQYPETIKEIISRTNNSKDGFRSVANDVLMPTSDVTPTGLAKASCVCDDDVVLGGDILVIRIDKNYLYGPFLSYVIRYSKNQILQLVTGTTVYHLYAADMRKFSLFLPPVPEQQAIAEALSDADSLIESLKRLIAKKRDIKQGVMQELLQPKATWNATCIGDIADPSKRWSFTGGPFGSNLKSSDYTNEGIRIIQLQNIGDGEFKDSEEVYTSIQKADELLSCNIYPGEIILSKMGDPVARACIVPTSRDRYLMCSDGIRLAVDEKRFDTYFVYTTINSSEFRTKAENAGTGSTRKRIGLTELRRLEILHPSLIEQTVISKTLSDMDVEIGSLEERLEKARKIKQGMMQELLTGRIRLI